MTLAWEARRRAPEVSSRPLSCFGRSCVGLLMPAEITRSRWIGRLESLRSVKV